MFKQALFQVHWLVGITAGIVLAVVGATGAILSFEHQIVDALNGDVRQVSERPGGPLPAPQLLARIAEQNPAKRVTALSVSAEPTDAARVTFAPERREPGNNPGPNRGGRRESRYVDPYTGALAASEGSRGEEFFSSMRSLHRWLVLDRFENREAGRQIVGAATALLVLLALSGVYLRWPRGRQSLRSWLLPDFRLKGRAFLWDLHAAVGTWVLVLYLFMGLTGLQWSYTWYRDALYAITGAERNVPRIEGSRGEQDTGVPDISGAWHRFETEARSDGFSTVNITLPGGEGEPVEFRYLPADPAHERAYNTLAVDGASGNIVRHEKYTERRFGAKIMASIFPLHSGSFFGMPGLILFGLASLAMPLFAVTGWMMYLERRKRRARAAARKGIGAAAAEPN